MAQIQNDEASARPAQRRTDPARRAHEIGCLVSAVLRVCPPNFTRVSQIHAGRTLTCFANEQHWTKELANGFLRKCNMQRKKTPDRPNFSWLSSTKPALC